jgi:NAD(P)-dependent dehydrogenase (short-subunit alcohol dehydrogenase family)
VFAAWRNPQGAADLRAIANANAGRVTILPLDVSDAGSIRNARQAVASHTDALDLLINNAGVYSTRVTSSGDPMEKLGSLVFDDALAVVRTNSVAPLIIVQEFLDLLTGGESPKQVSITSGYGSVSSNTGGFPYYYSASKAALNMLMRCFAFDEKSRPIITILLSPGWVRTDMGTAAAPLSPEQSVGGMVAVIDALTAKDNGRFLDYKGDEEPW